MTLEDTISSIRDQQTDQTDEFLAHFGVKGMHWGIRHQPTTGGGGGGRSSGGGSSSGSSRSTGSAGGGAAQRTGLSKKQKIAIGVGAAAVVALGAAAVAYNIKSGGKLSMGSLKVAKDLKGTAFKAASGGFDRAKAIKTIAGRELRAVPSTARLGAKAAGMAAQDASRAAGRNLGNLRNDLGGVARTTGTGVSRLAGGARVQANLGRREAVDAAARLPGAAAGAGRAVARDLQGLSESGRATFSRLYGEEFVSRVSANSAIASARLGDLKGVAKTTATGVSRLASAAPGVASSVARKAAGTAGVAIAKSGPQALANYQFRKITKGM